MTSHLHDPGGKVRTKLAPDVAGWADFSECGRYRRALGRSWSMETPKSGHVLFIGMNPSTADADANDPTVAREVSFARSWGYSSLVKCNIGDHRATHPSDLSVPGVTACTDKNVDEVIRRAREADWVVMAHGVPPLPLRAGGRRITEALVAAGLLMKCLGITKDGWPRHPLYLPKTAAPVAYDWKRPDWGAR
jgi:hypothetical protein